ncbi:MAG: hypothetical protein AB7O59_02220 [Pirellulales bacterium]
MESPNNDDQLTARHSGCGGNFSAQRTGLPWKEVESEVYRPAEWFSLSTGVVFLLAGLIGFFTVGSIAPPRMPAWSGKLFLAGFAALGVISLLYSVKCILWPARVRHASVDFLPNVPTEPELREGTVVHARVTHELVEDADGWELRPSGRLWRNDKRLLLGYSVPAGLLFCGLLSWILHDQHGTSWLAAILFAAIATTISGGTVVFAIVLLLRGNYRRLSRLSIPRNGDDLELDSANEPPTDRSNLHTALKWIQGDLGRRQAKIPRDLIAAVQLCPWKYACGDTRMWAVQSLLVLAPTEQGNYYRLPLLVTCDCIGAARLMQQLASTLNVPFLFCADAEGWSAEEARARNRPPLQVGGHQS